MKKKMRILAVLAAACVMSSCSVAGTAENLLSPPMLSAEQSEIYAALRKELGSEIKLKFPRAGDYRSAFIVANIDDEPTRIEVDFESKEDKITQQILTSDVVKKLFEYKTIKTFEEKLKETVVTRAERYAIIQIIKKEKINDFEKVRIVEKYTGFSVI